MPTKTLPLKRLLVLGATGQIGEYLVPRLLEEGFEVHGFTRERTAALNPRVTWFEKDVYDEDYPAIAYDAIIHLAFLPFLPLVLNHFSGSATLRRIVGFGSTSLFTKQSSANLQEQRVASQLQQAEADIAAWCESRDVAWTLFRPTLIYGCGRDKNITTITRFIRRFPVFPLAGSGGGLRQPVHAKDLAEAVMQSLHQPASYGKCYNLSGGETLTYRAMVARIFGALHKRARFIAIPLPLLKAGIALARRFKAYRYLSLEMATRMQQDLVFSHEEAARDFGYAPMKFTPEAD